MLDNDLLTAEDIAQRAMKIAGDLCIYTNHHTCIELLENKEELATTKPILGYWAIRGKGHQIKHLLAYCGIEYD